MRRRSLTTEYICVRRKGFTLVELVVTMAVLGILLAVSVGGLLAWQRHSNYLYCEEGAKTIFLAMQNALADRDAQGELDETIDELKQYAKEKNAAGYVVDETGSDNGYAAFYTDANQIAYLSVSGADYEAYQNGTASNEAKWLYNLLKNEIKGNDILGCKDGSLYSSNANVIVEIDVKTQSVHSVFYSAWAEQLTYASSQQLRDKADPHGVVSVDAMHCYSAHDGEDDAVCSRCAAVRKPRCLGYYAAEDWGNSAALHATQMKVQDVRLVNGDTLSVEFDSNVPYAENVKSGAISPALYTVDLYTADGTFICHMIVDTAKQTGVDAADGAICSIPVSFDAKSIGDTGQTGAYEPFLFPLCYQADEQGGTYALTLDAMMDATSLAYLHAFLPDDSDFSQSDLTKGSSICIRRLLDKAGVSVQSDIQAAVRAYPNADAARSQSEWSVSAEQTSNQENALFDVVAVQDGTQVQLSTFRHLYNIRYYNDQSAEQTDVTFVLMKNLDWSAHPTVYSNAKGTTLMRAENAAFAAVPALKANWTLTGKSALAAVRSISGITLDETSAVTLRTNAAHNAIASTENQADSLALILKNNGTIEHLTLCGFTVSANIDDAGEAQVTGHVLESACAMPQLHAAAALCAVNDGTIAHVNISDAQKATTVDAAVTADETQASGVALVAAVMGEGASIHDVCISEQAESVSAVRGTIAAGVQSGAQHAYDVSLRAGIGGAVGYADSKQGVQMLYAVKNGASVSGNTQVGGIVGAVKASDALRSGGAAQLYDCENTGLVLCAEAASDEQSCYGAFLGGIAGYAQNVKIEACPVQPQARTALQSNVSCDYIGGIVGFSDCSVLVDCSLPTDSCVLGRQYVGGIAGGMYGTSDGVYSCETRGEVEGSSVVGGIVGLLTGGSLTGEQAHRLTNRAAVTALDGAAGGIAGAAASGSTIAYADSDGNVTVSNGAAQQAGGIAGQNDGAISFCTVSGGTISAAGTSPMTINDICVGGIVGANGADASISDCTLTGQVTVYVVDSGVCGGIAGVNAGAIVRSGAAAGEGDWNRLLTNMNNLNNWGAYDDQGDSAAAAYAALTSGLSSQSGNVSIKLGKTGFCGGIAGINVENASLTQCMTGPTWTVDAGDTNACVGGIIGSNQQSDIKQLVSYAAVNTQSGQAGGIIGRQQTTGWTLTQCYNFGNVSAPKATYAGGIIGSCTAGGAAQDCHNYGAVTAEKYAGGLLGGDGISDNTLSFTSCTNHGAVSANSTAAGIDGYCDNTATGRIYTFSSCANYGCINGAVQCGISALPGGTVQMTYCQNYGTWGSANAQTYGLAYTAVTDERFAYNFSCTSPAALLLSCEINSAQENVYNNYVLLPEVQQPLSGTDSGVYCAQIFSDGTAYYIRECNGGSDLPLDKLNAALANGNMISIADIFGTATTPGSKQKATAFYRAFMQAECGQMIS